MPDFDGVSETRSGSERIYPGSHELRPISIIRVESPLVPEGLVVVARLQRPEAPQSQEAAHTPAQTLELLSAVAASIFDQVKQSTEVLAKLGHHTR